MNERKRDFAQLVRLLAGQKNDYVQLLALSEAQPEAFARGGSRALMKIIARKQKLLNHLRVLDRNLTPYTSRWDDTLAAMPRPARREINDITSESADLIGRIGETEKKARSVVTASRDALAGKVRGVSEGLSLAKAYAKPALASSGRILDREG